MSNEWISVLDDLPKPKQEIRFIAASGVAFNGWFEENRFYRGDVATEKWMSRYSNGSVTHWIPLLAPPK